MSNSKPAVSIIVPVYKVEGYLEECLDSIKSQTMTDWETILVDDGSPDGSGAICDRYAAEDNRFKVIHQENGGLSAARNSGLDAAKGKYIVMIDSDDYVEPEFIATLYNLITSTEADIAQVGFFREYVGFSRPKTLFKQREVLDGREAFKLLISDKQVPSYAWNKIYKRSVMTTPYPVGKNFEDIYTQSIWFKNVERYAVDPTPLYHYRIRRGSILNSRFAQNRLDYLDVCRFRAGQMMEFLPETYTPAVVAKYMNSAAVGAAKAIARREKDKAVRREAIETISREIKQYPLPKVGTVGLKKWLRMVNLRNSPRFFGWLMRAVTIIDFQSRHRLKRLYS